MDFLIFILNNIYAQSQTSYIENETNVFTIASSNDNIKV